MPACRYGNIYNCINSRQALLAASRAAPCRVLQSLVRLLRYIQLRYLLAGTPCYQLGCSLLGTPVTGVAAPKVGVHSCHCLSGGCYQKVSCKGHGSPCHVSPQEHSLQLIAQIQQLTTLGSSNPFPFILGSLPRVSSWLSNHQGGHQGHWTLVDQ